MGCGFGNEALKLIPSGIGQLFKVDHRPFQADYRHGKREAGSFTRRRLAPDAASVSANQGPDVGQAHSFALDVNDRSSVKGLKYLAQIGRFDTAAAIADHERSLARKSMTRDSYLLRSVRVTEFNGIIKQVGHDLFHGQSVGDHFRQRLDNDFHVALIELSAEFVQNLSSKPVHVEALEMQVPALESGQAQNRVYEVIHLAYRRIDESQGLGKVFFQCLDTRSRFFSVI